MSCYSSKNDTFQVKESQLLKNNITGEMRKHNYKKKKKLARERVKT